MLVDTEFKAEDDRDGVSEVVLNANSTLSLSPLTDQ